VKKPVQNLFALEKESMLVARLMLGVRRKRDDRQFPQRGPEGYGWPMQAWRPFGNITLQGQGL